MQFFDIVSQSLYQIEIDVPENLESLSDDFITIEELREMVGGDVYAPPYSSTKPATRTFILEAAIQAEIDKLAKKLDASGKKSILIGDSELVEILKVRCLSSYQANYSRLGDRICYRRKYTRKKTKPTQGNVNDIWSAFIMAFHNKYGCYPSHIPKYQRHIQMFRCFQKITGWKHVRKYVKEVKFCKQIWDNPKEYIK